MSATSAACAATAVCKVGFIRGATVCLWTSFLPARMVVSALKLSQEVFGWTLDVRSGRCTCILEFQPWNAFWPDRCPWPDHGHAGPLARTLWLTRIRCLALIRLVCGYEIQETSQWFMANDGHQPNWTELPRSNDGAGCLHPLLEHGKGPKGYVRCCPGFSLSWGTENSYEIHQRSAAQIQLYVTGVSKGRKGHHITSHYTTLTLTHIITLHYIALHYITYTRDHVHASTNRSRCCTGVGDALLWTCLCPACRT